MPVALHSFLFAPLDKTPRSRLGFWLGLSLVVAAIYPILALQEAFSSAYVVQDDARQHVFWMSRFVDPGLFPQDVMADYFQSVAPWGYATFYRLFAAVGIAPLLLHKCLPIVLTLTSTVFAFGATLQILPIPLAGFLAALLLNQSLWMRDDIISGTPVAFVYPIFLAFLYFLLRRALLPCIGAIVLQGLFYPQAVLIFAGVLLLQLWDWHRWRWGGDRRHYWFSGLGLAAIFLVLLPYVLEPSAFGPVITGTAARQLFTFSPNGWSAFFLDNPWQFWFCGKRSGLLPSEWCEVSYEINGLTPVPFGLPQFWFALALPLLLKYRDRFPLAQQIRPTVTVLLQVVLASIGCFLAAHALLFRLHLPNRYGEHSLRIVTALAAAIALTVLLDALLRPGTGRRSLRSILAAGLGIALLVYPYLITFEDTPFPVIRYRTGKAAALYEFFAQQPKDIQIASLATEANSLPSFAQRSIVVGGKGFVLPYHLGYYREMTRRTIDLMQAQYSPNLADVKQFIQQYSVDFWLLEKLSFQSKYLNINPVFEEFADTTQTIKPRIRQGAALRNVAKSCTVFQDEKFTVVAAPCIVNQP